VIGVNLRVERSIQPKVEVPGEKTDLPFRRTSSYLSSLSTLIEFDERMPNGRPRDLAASALREVHFSTDWQGTRLPNRVALLLAANWDLTGMTRAFARDDATGAWSAATLAHDTPRPKFLPQLRRAS
jgi:hypothetical protein